MHPARRPHLHLPVVPLLSRARDRATAAPRRRARAEPPAGPRCVPIRLRTRLSSLSQRESAPVQSCRGHITRQRGRSRSFVQANDMPKRNLERDPREIRFTDWLVMTNGGCSLVRWSRGSREKEKLVYRRVAPAGGALARIGRNANILTNRGGIEMGSAASPTSSVDVTTYTGCATTRASFDASERASDLGYPVSARCRRDAGDPTEKKKEIARERTPM